MSLSPEEDYERLTGAVAGESLPVAVVDLDAVDANVERLLGPVRAANKTLRIASKSVRCVELLRHIMALDAAVFRGVMSFKVDEAKHLVASGFDDVFVAYPSASLRDAETLASLAATNTVSIAVDDAEHLAVLGPAGAERGVEIPVVIDVDMSLRWLGDQVHLGVRRSPIADVDAVLALARRIRDTAGVRLYGVMGYEAQIAGMTDDSPFGRLLNLPKRGIKKLSRGPVERLRARIAEVLRADGFELAMFNGGGSGSVHWASAEDALTEVTAGSGFLDSHLFDYYRALDLVPAVFFAVQAVRRPAPGVVTCHGGGYVASGEAGRDRLPRPYLPAGLELFDLEGAGEVQTPLRLPAGMTVALGDPIFFRHAKAGELAEHFAQYVFVRGDRIVKRAPTYRGEGCVFL
ncbi:MAG: alanine racemase [Deltaproteobacteria bacterium]